MAGERIAVFIDGANLYATAKALAFDIDYRKMLKEFQARGRLVRAFYYTALAESEEFSSIRPLIDWLDYNGFSIVTKPAKEFIDSAGRRRIKGNMDIELAIDALELAPFIDHAIIVSGDGDLKPVVASLQKQGIRVSVMSSIASQPPMVSDELRRQCDEFIEIAHIVNRIGRDPQERAERLQRSAERRAAVEEDAEHE